MKIINMKKYGSVLTGRDFGKETYNNLKIEYPVALDFSGVNTLGSSYADEFLVPIALQQKNEIDVMHVNTPVSDCIKDVASDRGIKVNFKS